MSKDTNIEWPDSTLNPQMGCNGCELWNPKKKIFKCYAGQLTNRYGGKSKGYPVAFDQPSLFLHRLLDAEKWSDLTGTDREDKPWLNGLPRLIFLNDMGDTFTESLPLDWLSRPDAILDGRAPLEVLAGMKAIIMLLTKRPSRMRRFFEYRRVPDNFILMTSVTSMATIGRLKDLQAISAPWYGVSYEPAWGPVRFPKWLDLVIFGGESGPGRTAPDLSWARTVRDDCATNEQAFFMKQVDKVIPIPSDLLVRQMTPFTLQPGAIADRRSGRTA